MVIVSIKITPETKKLVEREVFDFAVKNGKNYTFSQFVRDAINDRLRKLQKGK